MIVATAVNNRILIAINRGLGVHYRVERKSYDNPNYLVYTNNGFKEESIEDFAIPVNDDFLDSSIDENKLYSYRCVAFDVIDPTPESYSYSNWVRINRSAIGYTFGNYKAPDGAWGSIVTPDDLRFTYLWGTDFRATNGQSYTDEQIQYFINSSVEEIERRLDIVIRKRKVRCNAIERKLSKSEYDVDESVYDFKFSKILRYGLIATRLKPIIKLHKIELLSRFYSARDITNTTIVDKTKGLLKLMERPLRPSDRYSGIQTAVGMYGNQTLQSQLFYSIDYDAGYETSDDVPEDLRQIIAKNAAVSLLNIIGDGLMSGFSSSSLSLDGMSESFSSTQSATSAYFGARIKVYQDEIENYIKLNKNKFGHMTIGVL